MAISATSSTPPPQPPAAADVATANTTQAQAAGATSPFQALLAASQVVQTTATSAATAASDLTDDNTDKTTDTNATDAANANLVGLAALAAQVLGVPVNATASQTVTGTPTEAQATRSRIDQLRLERTGGFISATLAGRAPTTAATTNATTQTTQTTPATPTTTAIPVPALTPNAVTAQTATAVAVRGGTSSIPAQAPIVANLTPNVPVPADPSVTNPPVAAPPALNPAAALPAAQLGDRAATTGDRFAAIAEAGALLAAAGAPGSVVFANTLEQALTAAGSTGTGDTVLPLVNISNQTTAAVVLPPLPTERTGESRPTDTRPDDATASLPAGATNPQGPLPAFDRIAEPAATTNTPAVQIADSIVTHAHVLERDGAVEFHMRLDPPDLGRVQIQLITRGDEVHGRVLVASEAVRQMLESQLPELRQRLEAAGVNVQQFSVATDTGTGGGNQNAYRSAMPEELAPRTASTATASAPRARIGRIDAGSLDVTV